VRQLRREVGYSNIMFIHLTYIPIPKSVHEQKSKPTQQSVRFLNESGIEPDVIIGRCSEPLEPKIKEKIALYCNVDKEAVISGLDVRSIYELPLIFESEGLPDIIHRRLNIYSPPNLRKWRSLVGTLLQNQRTSQRKINVAICGKYTALEDSYASINEALTHCEAQLDIKIDKVWIESTQVEDEKVSLADVFKNVQGVIVPGGFGTRGIEGKIEVIRYARENNIPLLGICFGMQLAVIEFARNVCHLSGANTTEIRKEGVTVKIPVIDLLPSQKNVHEAGGTMRLGGHDVEIKKGSRAHEIYKAEKVRERFRHRYEVNPRYIDVLEKSGIVFSGKAPGSNIMQIMELPNHRFFFGTQFHPELISQLEKPSEPFFHLIKSALS